MLSWLYFGAPVCLYLALVSLPRGRLALKGAIFVAALLVALWLMLMFLPFGDQTDTLGFFGLLTLTAAWFVGSTLQALRMRLPASAPGWVWPLGVALTLGVVGFIFLRLVSI